MTTNDERRADRPTQENRPDALPGHYRESADPQDTGVITSGHPERVSEDDEPAADTDDPSALRLVSRPAAANDDWDRLAVDFVDDPQRAVSEAARLVRETVERSTSTSDSDTEGLRTAFRRLRDLHRTLVSH